MNDIENAVTSNSERTETANVTTDENGVQIISVPNPSREEMQTLCENIREKFPMDVITKPVNFNFKKTKDKETGVEIDRQTVQLAVPYLSVQGLIKILEGGESKELDLVMESLETPINVAAREMLNEDINLNATTFPVEKLSWAAIANMPKAQRRGGGIPKETWEGFAEDYLAIMPGVTGKTIEQVHNMAKLLIAKLGPVKTNEPVLKLCVEQLGIYASNSPNAEDYQECVEFLLTKAETFLNVSEAELLANL